MSSRLSRYEYGKTTLSDDTYVLNASTDCRLYDVTNDNCALVCEDDRHRLSNYHVTHFKTCVVTLSLQGTRCTVFYIEKRVTV